MPSVAHSSMLQLSTKYHASSNGIHHGQLGTALLLSPPLPELPAPAPGEPKKGINNNLEGQEKLATDSPATIPPRTPSSQPLSPDLPNRDALYLFCNFSSYMRSPHEGSDCISPEDFKDTIRLLDYARVGVFRRKIKVVEADDGGCLAFSFSQHNGNQMFTSCT